METSTAYWFLVYYQYALLALAAVALLLAVFTQVGKRLERRSPRLFIAVMALLLLFLMAGAVSDVVHAARTGVWGVTTALRPVAYIFFGIRLAERAKAALQHKRAETEAGPGAA